VLPAKDGRGYVLRRIMRRAMRHAHILGASEPLMWKLVPALVRQMGGHYPELVRAEPLITETLRLEETTFRQTLGRGLQLLDEALHGKGLQEDGKTLSGTVAFQLYDTYGFPLDLTQDILRSRHMRVDDAGFEREMTAAKERSRASWIGSGDSATEKLWFELDDKLGATEFLGYETDVAEGRVVALVVDGKSVERIEAGTKAQLLVNQTPFYGESGGQMGDSGAIFTSTGAEFQVADTLKKAGELHVHVGTLAHGKLAVGDAVELRIDGERRRKLRANHSVTHLLHQALRRRLGAHVTQKGSLVAPDRMRFDFSHPRPMTSEDIHAIEGEVNARIRENAEVTTRLMTPDKAVSAGALALFGEKYGDEVRVVSMGDETTDTGDHKHFSVELCGGTHVRRTGDIGIFKIVSESAVAAGVRRVEVMTGAAAEAHLAEEEGLLRQAAGELKVTPQELPTRVAGLLEERKRLEREMSDLRRKLASGGGNGAAPQAAKDLGGVKFIGRILDDVPAKELKSLADDMKKSVGSGVVAVVARADGKASIVVAVTDDLVQRFNAVDFVRAGAEALGGKGGGGRPDMAQAGGPDAGAADAAVAAVERAVAAKAAA
jgi:alanyl-tRNA synthetase